MFTEDDRVYDAKTGRLIEDKPWTDDWKEAGKQTLAGAVLDFPQAIGNAMQAISPKNSAMHEQGEKLVNAIEPYKKNWMPNTQGRGEFAQFAIRNIRPLAASLMTMPAYLAGPVTGVAATAGVFGGSQFQKSYQGVKDAGGTDNEALKTGLVTGAIKGGSEAASTALGLKLLLGGKPFSTLKPAEKAAEFIKRPAAAFLVNKGVKIAGNEAVKQISENAIKEAEFQDKLRNLPQETLNLAAKYGLDNEEGFRKFITMRENLIANGVVGANLRNKLESYAAQNSTIN